jgi:hypothetical protein
VGEALVDAPTLAVATKDDGAKEHLHPSPERVRLPDHAVRDDGVRAERALVDVQLKVHAEHELREERDDDDVPEFLVRGRGELPPSVRMPEKDARERQRDAGALRASAARSHTLEERRTCRGTCQRLLVMPRTMPTGKRTPQTAACKKMCIQRMVSTGALRVASST